MGEQHYRDVQYSGNCMMFCLKMCLSNNFSFKVFRNNFLSLNVFWSTRTKLIVLNKNGLKRNIY